MHIIKITPSSFKIILSKEDLQTLGDENIFNSKELSKEFFAQIIDETNRLYGNPFATGSVDAEFFEGKDGGGELFISKGCCTSTTTYLFTTQNFENLLQLCNRISQTFMPENSTLYYQKNGYGLILKYKKGDGLILSCLKEYGHAVKVNRIRQWILEEHAVAIVSENAVSTLSQAFGS